MLKAQVNCNSQIAIRITISNAFSTNWITQIKSFMIWMGREIKKPNNAQGAAFFPLIWIHKMLADDLLGFEKLYVPRRLVWERLNPDFDAFRLSPKRDDDHRPRKTKLRFWNPKVTPLKVFEIRAPWVVLRLNPLKGCQDRDGLRHVVLAKRNLIFFEKTAQLNSNLLKKGLGFLLI